MGLVERKLHIIGVLCFLTTASSGPSNYKNDKEKVHKRLIRDLDEYSADKQAGMQFDVLPSQKQFQLKKELNSIDHSLLGGRAVRTRERQKISPAQYNMAMDKTEKYVGPHASTIIRSDNRNKVASELTRGVSSVVGSKHEDNLRGSKGFLHGQAMNAAGDVIPRVRIGEGTSPPEDDVRGGSKMHEEMLDEVSAVEGNERASVDDQQIEDEALLRLLESQTADQLQGNPAGKSAVVLKARYRIDKKAVYSHDKMESHGESDLCVQACGHCRMMLSLRWAALCVSQCNGNGPIYSACVTLWTNREKIGKLGMN